MSAPTQVTVEPTTLASSGPPKRRRYSIAEKRRIVEETFEAAASVARVARAHGINANQVFSWRRLYQRGRLGGGSPEAPVQSAEFLPVAISERPAAPAPIPAPLPMGAIQLQLPRGRLRIEGSVDLEALRLVLQCMLT